MSHKQSGQFSLLIRSIKETEYFGQRIAEQLRGGEVIGLSGSLGAGKTELVRAIAAGLGIKEGVTSPSFVLENIYELPEKEQRGITSLHHWDLYRITGEFLQNELVEYDGEQQKVVVVEWPERVSWVERLLTLRIRMNFREDMPEQDQCRMVVVSQKRGSGRDHIYTRLERLFCLEKSG